MAPSRQETGRCRGKMLAASKSNAMSTARRASMYSMVRRLSQRSTKTPASGPTTSTGIVTAKAIPPTASVAHGCSPGNGRGDPEHKRSVKNDIACTGYEVAGPQQRKVAIDEQVARVVEPH